ncbi:MAG: Crp/Fnr family transcriptional regulator [Actinomycetales bacterium]|nr:Crp/Fnr family transcriptional regulator [Actinomycetales bacterium]
MRTLDGVPFDSSAILRGTVPTPGQPTTSLARPFLEFFAGAALPEWDSFARSIRIMRLRPQEVLYDVGEEHPYIYLVRRGSVRVGFTDGRGRECLLAFCRPPDLLASVSAIVPPGLRRLAEPPTGITKMRATIGVGRTATRASALEATELERLDFRVMERLMGRHASWSIAVYNAVVLHALVKERRERELLTMTPEERYRQFLEDHDDLIGVVPQKDIAGYLGVTPVGLSRIATRVRNESAGLP